MTSSQISLERGLPASVEAECTVLGAILLDNAAFDQTVSLRADDFSLDSHRRIYACMGNLIRSGIQADHITLSEELDRRKELESIGNRAYLFSLTENLPRRLSIEDYVSIVKNKARLRMILGIATEIAARASDGSEEPLDIINASRIALEEILSDSAIESNHVGSYTAEILEKWVSERRSTEHRL